MFNYYFRCLYLVIDTNMKKIATLLTALAIVPFLWAQNPYLPLWEHLPDGEPRHRLP